MKKFIALFLILSIFAAFASVVSAEGTAFFYVATGGSDTADGSITAPFASVSAALEAARKVSGQKVIYLRDGKYSLKDTINMTADDKDIIISAYGDEKVTVGGGNSVPYSAFSKVTDKAILDRIIEMKGKTSVVSADLKTLGITDYGKMKVQGFVNAPEIAGYAPTLSYKDELLDYAGYPNNGYVYTSQIVRDGVGSDFYSGELVEVEFKINDERFRKWTNADDIWAVAFFCHDWADLTVPAKIDSGKGTIISYNKYQKTYDYNIRTDRRVRFMNLLEELDAPGEWYLDRNTGILYVIPPEKFGAGDELDFNSFNKNIISMNGCKNVEIRKLKIADTCGMGIVMENCENVVVNGCDMTGIGDAAVSIKNSVSCGVENSHIHDLGSKGVNISCGDRQTLTPGKCFVRNCHIEDFMNYRKTYAPGISISGVGNTVSNNEIHNSPHFAISYGGNNNIFEYNNIYDVCRDTADCGAIYVGHSWTTRGNEIRWNYFHDMQMIDTNTGMEMQAVYLDDMHAATRVFANVFYKCDSVALFGGGRYNQFVNNLMLECKKPFVMDNRGTWDGRFIEMGQSMIKDLANYPYKEGIWAESYPELVNILNDEPLLPKHNTIKNNVMYKTPDLDLYDGVKEYGTVENNITITKTDSFNDYRNKDFSLKEGSEILTKIPGFEQIPMDKIGTYDYKIEDIKDTGKPQDDKIKVVLNGNPLSFDVDPAIINSRTMVPLRAIFEALGAEVSWDDGAKTVTATKGDTTITMQIGNDTMTKNGQEIQLDTAPQIIDSRTLVPVRAIAEAFGSKVGWIETAKTVTIDN